MANVKVKITVEVDGNQEGKVVLREKVTGPSGADNLANEAHRAIDKLRQDARRRAGV